MSSNEEKLPPHVLIFPLPAQGHINPMLNLAHLFCLSQFHVTFIVSEFSHRRLLKNSAVPTAFARYPGFQFRALPDGLPDDHPRAGEKFFEMIPSVTNVMVPSFKKMMIQEEFLASGHRRPVTCIVSDGSLSFVGDFAEENGLPLVYFRTAAAGYLWTLFCYPQLLQAQEIPFIGKSMDGLVKSIPGMEGFLRQRDLPIFYRVDDVNEPILKNKADVTSEIVRAQAAIFNTCEDLEGPIVSQIQKHMSRIYSIGPIHEQLKSRLVEEKAEASIVPASLWPVDRGCIDWLNLQPRKSVIYVSFGSVAVLSSEKLVEIWHGLVNSSQRFLWVMRPDSISGNDRILHELMEGTKEKGLLVEWAPQEEVLNHPAVGGFLTHSGWNSTLESIAAGVPMICWPYSGDQTTNSRFVSEVWKMGLDIKDTCDRLIVEKAVRELMVVRKDEFLERADEMAKLVKKAVSKGGSSYRNIDDLTEYIKSLVI
ncbi:hypothetical protein C2S53_010330 [Perilla frutescens var. hirtella]|uniref:Glycosyltransferase n=1 Tax=Perilla frutescens var. hirtella TaxID=608512 RepID=A0AAD4P031_PERFH|nr:hypothetical protein C2S53_010330 [Perilla frutescens var. hirtella]